jgi:hypothetical protein
VDLTKRIEAEEKIRKEILSTLLDIGILSSEQERAEKEKMKPA